MKIIKPILIIALIIAVFGMIHPSRIYAEEVVKLGVYLPFTGWAANYGEDAKRGIDLAVEDINATGGIHGKKIECVYEDSGANPKQAVSAVQKLINIDRVPFIIGGLFSHTALAIAPIAQSNKIPTIATQASHPDVTKAGDFIFRIAPPMGMERLIVKYAYEVIGARRYSGLVFSTDMGRTSMKMAEESFPKLGGKIAKIEFFTMGTTDFKTHLLKIKDENPDVIEIKGGIKETAQIIRQMTELQMDIPILGSNMFREPKLWELVGERLKGAAYPTYSPSGSAKTRHDKFEADYKKKYGFEPKTVVAAFTYDAAKLAAFAYEKGGLTGPRAQKALIGMKNFPGITGDITFKKGEREARYCVEKIMGPGVYEMTDFCTYIMGGT